MVKNIGYDPPVGEGDHVVVRMAYVVEDIAVWVGSPRRIQRKQYSRDNHKDMGNFLNIIN